MKRCLNRSSYWILVSAVILSVRAFVPATQTRTDHRLGNFGSRRPWCGYDYNARTKKSRWRHRSRLCMVLNTPESIIEKASTEILLDELIDESTRVSARRPIMLQFDPTGIRIWRRWRGTIFAETWSTCVRNMVIAMIIAAFYRCFPSYKSRLTGFNILWGQLLSVATFTLTFFVNQSFSLWRKCYEYSRRLQGRLNDLGLTLAAHATRVEPSREDEDRLREKDERLLSTYTPEAKQVLQLVARYIRLFNLLTYASFTRSHRPILTPIGMRRMVDRGLMTQQEKDALTEADVAATQRHNAILLWIVSVFNESRRAGHIQGGAGFEQQFMEKIHVIRAQYGAIGDELQGRMPLAYAHIVQVLVDTILWMYPFMAFSSGMSPTIGVLGCGLLTMFYQGLVDLAKQFLDPYDNESYGKGHDPLCVDTLIAETNAGSVRWLSAFEFQPWSARGIRRGDMKDIILPIRGYSVKELKERKEAQEAEAFLQDEKKLKSSENEETSEQNASEAGLSFEQATMLGDSHVQEDFVTASSGIYSDENSTAIELMDVASSALDENVLPELVSQELEAMKSFPVDKDKETENIFTEYGTDLSSIGDDSTYSKTLTVEKTGADFDESIEGDFDAERPLTLKEFERETAEIIAAAEKEMLETEAILNAPPGADYVEVDEPKTDDYDVSSDSDESTEALTESIDTQAVYNAAKERLVKNAMEISGLDTANIDDFVKKAEEIIDAAEEETLETEAILGAPPGADSLDYCDPVDDDYEECQQELLSKKSNTGSDPINDDAEEKALVSDELKTTISEQNKISGNEIDILGMDDPSVDVEVFPTIRDDEGDDDKSDVDGNSEYQVASNEESIYHEIEEQ